MAIIADMVPGMPPSTGLSSLVFAPAARRDDRAVERFSAIFGLHCDLIIEGIVRRIDFSER
jgi:hypothetical protein